MRAAKRTPWSASASLMSARVLGQIMLVQVIGRAESAAWLVCSQAARWLFRMTRWPIRRYFITTLTEPSL
jgi:hypothetical protein